MMVKPISHFLVLLIVIHLQQTSSIHSLTRSANRIHGKGHGQGKGSSKATIDQTAKNVAKAKALERQKLQSRLSMKTQAQIWAKQQAESMASAEASMAAKEQIRLEQDARQHATTEASIYAKMDLELNLAQTAANANTPSLARNPRLAKKHKKTVEKTKQSILLEQILTPEKVKASKKEEHYKRMERRISKMPKEEEISDQNNMKEKNIINSFLEINTATPSWWPKASSTTEGENDATLPSYTDIISNVFQSTSFQNEISSMPTLSPPARISGGINRAHHGGGGGLFHHQNPMKFLQVQASHSEQQQRQQQQQQSTNKALPAQSSFDSQLKNDAAKQFSSMVGKADQQEESSRLMVNELQGNGSPPSLFGAGSGGSGIPGITLSSGGDPFAGTMPPPSGVKYQYTPIPKQGVGSDSSRPPPPPPPLHDAPPDSGERGVAGKDLVGTRSIPKPINPDEIVKKEFLPHSPAVASTTATLPSSSSVESDDGSISTGIANYETEPM